MTDTGKMKKLWERCTGSMIDDPLSYPDGDLDRIAEQISLRLDDLVDSEKELSTNCIAAERKVARMSGFVHRAKDLLDSSLRLQEPE